MGVGDAAQDIEGQFDDFSRVLLEKLGPGNAQEANTAVERIEICGSTEPVVSCKDESVLALNCTVNRPLVQAGNARPHHELVFSSPSLRYCGKCDFVVFN